MCDGVVLVRVVPMEYGSPALPRVHVYGFDIVFETLQQVAYKLGTAIPHARKEIQNGAPI